MTVRSLRQSSPDYYSWCETESKAMKLRFYQAVTENAFFVTDKREENHSTCGI